MRRRPAQLSTALFLATLLVASCATAGRGSAPAVPESATAPAAPAAAAGEAAGALALPPPRALPLSSREESFLAARLSRLSYLVYFDESAGLDSRLARLAVNQINRYLQTREGLAVIDFDRVVTARKEVGWEAGTTSAAAGRSPAFRRLCLSLGADVHVELAFSVQSEVRDGKYYALARGEMRIRDAATASLLGTVAFEGQPSISPSSMDAAVTNAVTQAVWLAMPAVTARARELLGQTLRRGLCYELVVKGLDGSKAVVPFARELSDRVREIVSVPSPAGELDFLVFDFLDPQTLEASIREAAALSGLAPLEAPTVSGRLFAFGLAR